MGGSSGLGTVVVGVSGLSGLSGPAPVMVGLLDGPGKTAFTLAELSDGAAAVTPQNRAMM